MAKVSGPLMSVSASGAFASSMVFATWKGRAYVRQLVVPPGDDYSQEDARVQAICAATHTADVVEAYKAKQAANAIPAG